METIMENSSIITLQLSIFGDYSQQDKSTSFIISLLQVLKEDNFLPQSIQNKSINPANGEVTKSDIISLDSQSTNWKIVLMNNRIDFNYVRTNQSDPIKGLDTLIVEGIQNIERVLTILNIPSSPTIGNRLAVNVQTIIEDLPDEDINKIGKKIITAPISQYESSFYEDWSASVNKQIHCDINKHKKEIVNYILEIEKIVNVNKDSEKGNKAILVHNDINTIPQNSNPRFTKEDFISFIKLETIKTFIQNSITEISEKKYEK